MKILVATDGSESARLAVDFLAEFPFPADSAVTVITVIEPILRKAEIDELNDEQAQAYEATRQSTKQAATELIDGEAARLKQAGRASTTRLRSGNPAEEIVDTAEEMNADVIVVGSHGTGGIKRVLLGSVSERILNHAPGSVLIVKSRPATDDTRSPDDGHQLLVAFDDSPPARHAVKLCAGMPLGDTASVTVLSVMALVKIFRQDVRQKMSLAWQGRKAAVEQALNWATRETDWNAAEVTPRIEEAENVSDAILDIAEADQSDLIVIGDKGKSAVTKFLLGSVTGHVARYAPCSVWVVRE